MYEVDLGRSSHSFHHCVSHYLAAQVSASCTSANAVAVVGRLSVGGGDGLGVGGGGDWLGVGGGGGLGEGGGDGLSIGGVFVVGGGLQEGIGDVVVRTR